MGHGELGLRALSLSGASPQFVGCARGGFELIELLQRGCGAAPQFDVGLRRRNNEFNELTNCRAARRRGIAPVRGRIFQDRGLPLSPPQLINSRCCPCKGRILWAGLAPQYLSRYEPLTGARFINRLQEVGASPYPKYEPLSGALARQFTPNAATKFVNSINSLLRRLRPNIFRCNNEPKYISLYSFAIKGPRVESVGSIRGRIFLC